MIARTPRIRRLPPLLVNQIAAGEVVERPASVVKELLENCIDAGAVNVQVELEAGGKRLIRVSDDGIGIAPADLPLAVASHATSKLEDETGLHSIRTLGFRGEALASIASVSELDILSRPATEDAGQRIEVKAGEAQPGRPEPMPAGTRITVRNLFANVPARRRFLKSDRAELTRISTVVNHIALAIPNVAFTVVHEGKTVLRYPAAGNHEERVREVLGERYGTKLIPIDPTETGAVRGWVGRPELSRRGVDGIYVFLNGRFVRDKVVLHAVKEAYRGFQIPGHNPVAILFINISPEEVDVNVHPAKLEVRFRDSSQVHSAVFGAVRRALNATGSVPQLFPEQASSAPTSGGFSPRSPSSSPLVAPTTSYGPPALPPRAERVAEELVDGRQTKVFQVKNAYLIVEEEAGLTIIDQHALHEKILFEEILEARERGDLSQPLLVPETVHLDPTEWQGFTSVRQHLQEMAFDVEEFGDRTVIVRGVPTGFEEQGVERLLRDAIHRLVDAKQHGAKTDIELRERLVATLACKRAVKAGDHLSSSAQLDLIAGRARAFQPQNCPHGRPAELFISWEELERRFDRK